MKKQQNKKKQRVQVYSLIMSVLIVVLFALYCGLNNQNNQLLSRYTAINDFFAENILDYYQTKTIFMHHKQDFEKIVKILNEQFEDQRVFVKYRKDGEILCNGAPMESNEKLNEIYMLLQTSGLLCNQGTVELYYDGMIYTPNEKPGIPEDIEENNRSKQRGFGIHFYFRESQYGRMGIKYVSLQPYEERGRAMVNKLGKEMIPSWYYYLSPWDYYNETFNEEFGKIQR